MISPVLLSEVQLPEHHPRADTVALVFGFVVHHARGPVLVDTGVGAGHALVDSVFAPIHHRIEDALVAIGIQVGEVAMVINSHLHFDHCGNNRLFPGVPMVVQRTEYEAATQPGYTIPEWIDFPGAEWRLQEGEAEVLPGIRVVPTPGHTAGHQSVIADRTKGGGVDVIAGQAIYDADELDAEASAEPLSDEEADQTAASARRIKAESPQWVFFSHDHRVWVDTTMRAGG